MSNMQLATITGTRWYSTDNFLSFKIDEHTQSYNNGKFWLCQYMAMRHNNSIVLGVYAEICTQYVIPTTCTHWGISRDQNSPQSRCTANI